jgi:hypothetical protein
MKGRRRLFVSIEDKHGVDDPSYEAPQPTPDEELVDDSLGDNLGLWEACLAFGFPIAGLGLAKLPSCLGYRVPLRP